MLRPRMSRERKKFRLRSARKPTRDYRISGTVIVEDIDISVCYIQFDECFIEAIGKIMPRGVSADDPVHLRVSHTKEGTWAVYASYIGRLHGQELLWIDPDKPSWVRERRPPHHK